MDSVLLVGSKLLLIASVPLILAVRFARPDRMPWGLVVALSAATSWVLANFGAHAEMMGIAERAEAMRENPYTPGDWAYSFYLPHTLLWGWRLGIVYLAVCLVPYCILCTISSRFGSKRDPAA